MTFWLGHGSSRSKGITSSVHQGGWHLKLFLPMTYNAPGSEERGLLKSPQHDRRSWTLPAASALLFPLPCLSSPH